MKNISSVEWDYIKKELKTKPMIEYKGMNFFFDDIKKINFILNSLELPKVEEKIKFVKRNNYKSEINKQRYHNVVMELTSVNNKKSLNQILKDNKLAKTTYYRLKDLEKEKDNISIEDIDIIE